MFGVMALVPERVLKYKSSAPVLGVHSSLARDSVAWSLCLLGDYAIVSYAGLILIYFRKGVDFYGVAGKRIELSRWEHELLRRGVEGVLRFRLVQMPRQDCFFSRPPLHEIREA